MIADLSEIPAMAEYMRRIGAEPRALRTAVVREVEGRYRRDLATIHLDAAGQVTVRAAVGEDAAAYEPTDAERHAIAIEAVAARWPEHRACATTRNLPDALLDADREDIFEFRDGDGNIIMLQLRVETDGDKRYVPYTYWNDDQWRKMEPEGDLPLWGIDQLKNCVTAFIHEGAKAARAVRRMVEEAIPEAKEALAAHPWGEGLRHAAHVGWIGGALAPHRTDWSVLHKFGVQRVIIVADNDPPGDAAVPKIARALRHYPIRVQALRFDERWPVGFDLADSFPPTMFVGPAGERRYTGSTMAEGLEPATWMTRVGTAPPAVGRGPRPQAPIYLRAEAAEDYVMRAGETQTSFIVRENPRRQYSDVGFDRFKGPFSDHPRPSALFAKQAFGSRVDELTYAPGEEARIITVDGDRSFNMHVPARLKPLRFVPTEADWQPWLDYTGHLFPSADERGHVHRYLATMYARPGVRMLYALLLASGMQGVGKTTLGLISEVQVGRRNCSTPTAQQVVNSAFNSWVACKRLVVVNEIYEEGNWASYDKLKTYITEPFIRVNQKNIPEYNVPNCAHFMLFSNSDAPLQLGEHDRRIFAPSVTENKYPPGQPDFWRTFYDWLEGDGHSIIRHWAEAFVSNPKLGAVRSGDPAPMTARKQQMIEGSRSPNERMARDLADAALAQAAKGSPVVLVDWEVCAWLASNNGHAVKPLLLHRWLTAAGLHLSDDRMKAAGRMGKVAATTPIIGKSWTELQEYHQRPSELESW